MEVNYGKESISMEKIEKLSNPKVKNLLQRIVNIKCFSFKLHQDFGHGLNIKHCSINTWYHRSKALINVH